MRVAVEWTPNMYHLGRVQFGEEVHVVFDDGEEVPLLSLLCEGNTVFEYKRKISQPVQTYSNGMTRKRVRRHLGRKVYDLSQVNDEYQRMMDTLDDPFPPSSRIGPQYQACLS